MKKLQENIAILGAGNIGKAIAKGIVDKELARATNLILTRRHLSYLEDFQKQGFHITSDNKEAVSKSKYIFLCVQPNQLSALLNEINTTLSSDHVIVSVITGISIKQISDIIDTNNVIMRAMPNTAIAIGESMTCLSTNGESDNEMSYVVELFNTLGKTLIIEEELMQAATVLGASGIAFFMRYLRAATQAGVQMGFHTDEAQLVAVQTARGAASLLLKNNTHPELEIDKVTTPQGCTIEGLNEMEHQGFSSSLIKGVMTSFHKIKSIKS